MLYITHSLGVQCVPPETKIPFLGWHSRGPFIISNPCRHQNQLVFKALKTQIARPGLTMSDSVGLQWGPRRRLSSKLLGNAYAAGLGSSF